MSRFALIVPCLLFLAGCKKQNGFDCFKTTGTIKTETRYTGTFTDIEVSDKVDVVIVSGSIFRVDVNAGEHLIKNIATTVADGKLTIADHNTCNFVRGYKKKITVTVTMPQLRFVLHNGVGDVHIQNLVQDSISVDAESSGDIYIQGTFRQVNAISKGDGDLYLSGSSQGLYVYLFGTNFLYAQSFIVSGDLEVQTVSIGNCYVNASVANTLEATIWRLGNVYYTGAPVTIIRNYEEDCKGRLISGS